jgi:hypothetical protein
MGIAENIAARKAAEELAELLGEEAIKHGDSDHFWEVIARILPSKYRPTKQEAIGPAMTDEESREFEMRPMPFGTHMNKQIRIVPLDYLLWLEEQPDFRRDLNRYLRNPQIQALQESEV